MSIQSEISRIQSNVQDTINVIQSTGVAVPPGANSDNLPGLAAALANEKQDKLTGTQGQVVGFDSQGNAVAQESTSSGVTSFEGRTGAITAQEGDYTAAMVGAVPTTRTVNGKALSADVEIGAGDVSYDNSETSAIITGDNVQSAIDQLFTSVSNGKSLIAGAITDKGVSTSASDSFQQMAANIGAIETGTEIQTVIISLTPINPFHVYYIDKNLNFQDEFMPAQIEPVKNSIVGFSTTIFDSSGVTILKSYGDSSGGEGCSIVLANWDGSIEVG